MSKCGCGQSYCAVNDGLLTVTPGPRFVAQESCTRDGSWVIKDMHQGERTVLRVAADKVSESLAHVVRVFAEVSA